MRERNDTGLAEVAEAGRQYAAAYAAHYTTKDLREALRLYRDVMAAHPNTQEAGYSQSQIRNIVNAVVPRQELLDAQVDLALAHFDQEDQADLRRAQAQAPASEPTS